MSEFPPLPVKEAKDRLVVLHQLQVTKVFVPTPLQNDFQGNVVAMSALADKMVFHAATNKKIVLTTEQKIARKVAKKMRRGKLCLCPLCAPLYAEGIAIGAAAVQATVPAASVPAVAFALTAHPVRANVLLPAPAVVRTAPQPVSQHEIDEKHAESTGDEKQGNSPRTLPVLPVCTYSDATRSAKRRQRRRAARTFPQCDATPPAPASSRAPANARASVAPTSGSLDARPGRA